MIETVSETVRERILQAMQAAMSDVVVARGFNTNIGHSVYRSRSTFFEDEVPVSTLNDGEEVTSVDEYGGDRSIMQVSIQVLINENTDDTYSKELNSIIGEFKNAIGSSDPTWNDLAEDTQCIGFVPLYPEEDGIKTIAGELSYQVTYVTIKGDPYSVLKP